MMDMGIQTLFGLICGTALAYGYFKVLWHSIRHLPNTKHQSAFLWGMFLYRVGIFTTIAICMIQESKMAFVGMITAFFITRLFIIQNVRGTTND